MMSDYDPGSFHGLLMCQVPLMRSSTGHREEEVDPQEEEEGQVEDDPLPPIFISVERKTSAVGPSGECCV
ncbi:unnamed protein product [Pleuronectes platessa]|uniref:Uncharacterized protein n=1 Tax=Pleuronectes platessa TaxID=8262 RepID=A0A9N7VXC2_PLEPL|nr:unnamed protein product [Pleuronectes platessa]